MSSVFTFDNGDSPGVFSVLSGLVLTAGRGLEQPWVPFSVFFGFLLVFLRLLAEDRDLEQPRVSFSVSSVFMGSLLESVQHKLHGISSRNIVKIWSYLENTYLSPLCCSPLFFSLFPPSPSQRQCLCFFVIFPQSEGKSLKKNIVSRKTHTFLLLHLSYCTSYLWTLTMSLWLRSCTFSMRKEISSTATSNFFFSANSSFRCKLLASSAFRSTFYNTQNKKKHVQFTKKKKKKTSYKFISK